MGNFKLTTVIPVVFILAGIAVNLLFSHYSHGVLGGFGGPALAEDSLAEDLSGSLVADNNSLEGLNPAESDEDTAGFILVESSSLLDPANPLSNIIPDRHGLMTYKIQDGDSLSKIAANFGISLNTILWANNDLKTSFIKPGQEIVVLPVSGVVHQVQDGETLESIANLYSVDMSQILKYNPRATVGNLDAGITLVIPGAKPKTNLASVSYSSLPDLKDYFIIPAAGWNWARLHNFNAVDVANACGTPIYAAAEGLIIDEKSYGWNGGYGHYVDIKHPVASANEVITRYAHTERNFVSVGDYVLQGDLIGYIGNTGNTHGPTGCHLHFEVRGAKNPFATK